MYDVKTTGEDVMLSEISQSQKDICCMIPLKIVNFIETKSRMVVTRGWVEGKKGNCSMSMEFQFLKMTKVLKICFTIM